LLAEAQEAKEEPPVAIVVEEPAEDGWGGWGTAKTKKKGKKAADPELAKAEPKVEDPAPVEDEWSTFGSSKKDKKKKGKNFVEEPTKVSTSTCRDADCSVSSIGILVKIPLAVFDARSIAHWS
jgi:hypothetical protein